MMSSRNAVGELGEIVGRHVTAGWQALHADPVADQMDRWPIHVDTIDAEGSHPGRHGLPSTGGGENHVRCRVVTDEKHEFSEISQREDDSGVVEKSRECSASWMQVDLPALYHGV
jgi:hypothetical protein